MIIIRIFLHKCIIYLLFLEIIQDVLTCRNLGLSGIFHKCLQIESVQKSGIPFAKVWGSAFEFIGGIVVFTPTRAFVIFGTWEFSVNQNKNSSANKNVSLILYIHVNSQQT